MRIGVKSELILLNLLVCVLIMAIILSPSNLLRIILGLPFLLFFPGYTLMAVLFPRKAGIGTFERAALSFGMSIAVVSLIGLILNYTPWGIRLESVLYSIASFIFIASGIAWLRRRRLPEQERFGIEFQVRVLGLGSGWDRVLSITLALTFLGASGTLGYALASPKVGERFTEFYILGLIGKAIDYPKELVLGEEERVRVGIINREHESMTYRVEVVIDGVKNSEVGPVTLEHDGKWEGEIGFVLDVAGENQKVEFLLYRQGQNEVYQRLHLWVDVIE
ncbi:DUF1616 domain-containing protein [Chloroflexota bacterium]